MIILFPFPYFLFGSEHYKTSYVFKNKSSFQIQFIYYSYFTFLRISLAYLLSIEEVSLKYMPDNHMDQNEHHIVQCIEPFQLRNK